MGRKPPAGAPEGSRILWRSATFVGSYARRLRLLLHPTFFGSPPDHSRSKNALSAFLPVRGARRTRSWNAGEPLDDRSGAIVARQRFLASRTNSFGQGQFSDARELALSPFTRP